MAFYFGSRPEPSRSGGSFNRFVARSTVAPRTSAAVELFRDASRHLVGVRWEAALSAAESGLRLEPACPGLMMQAAVATRKLGRTDRLLDLFDRLKGTTADPAEPAAVATRAALLPELFRSTATRGRRGSVRPHRADA
jgi:hypothetical protein